jgi:hypothetical protein
MKLRWRTVETPFPLRIYLTQLFFRPLSNVIWSPMEFWCHYRVQLLEECWNYDYRAEIQFLEKCWMKTPEQKLD